MSALDTTSCPVAPGLSPPPHLTHQHLQPDHVGPARDVEEAGWSAGGDQGLQDQAGTHDRTQERLEQINTVGIFIYLY